jgi:hypothetical protein
MSVLTRLSITAAVLSGAIAGRPAPARADDAVGAPVLLSARAWSLALALEATTTGGHASLAPDAWYGVNDRLTMGVTHSHRSRNSVGAERGLCVAGCLSGDDPYRGTAFVAHFRLPGNAGLVGLAATDVATWSPARASFVLGVIASWHQGRWSAQAAPRVALGLLGRADGNRESLEVGVTLRSRIVGPIAVESGIAVVGPAASDIFANATTPAWAQLVVRPRANAGVGIGIGTSDLLGRTSRRGYAEITFAVQLPS